LAASPKVVVAASTASAATSRSATAVSLAVVAVKSVGEGADSTKGCKIQVKIKMQNASKLKYTACFAF
jgi:hypothetical protein